MLAVCTEMKVFGRLLSSTSTYTTETEPRKLSETLFLRSRKQRYGLLLHTENSRQASTVHGLTKLIFRTFSLRPLTDTEGVASTSPGGSTQRRGSPIHPKPLPTLPWLRALVFRTFSCRRLGPAWAKNQRRTAARLSTSVWNYRMAKATLNREV